MLNICDVEMRNLDLKFNPLKCHVSRVGKNYDSECNNVLLDNCAITFDDSITYLGTLIRAGRTWRTDSSPRRRQYFKAFNSIFCKSGHLSEPALQQLAESFCMPVILYNLDATGVSKSECTRIEHAWNTMMYKIYGVSGDMLHLIYAYTNCIPLKSELLRINYVYKKVIKFTSIFYKIRTKMNDEILKMLYFAFVFPHLLYGIEIYQSHLSKLVKLNNKILRILQNAPLKSLTLSLYKNYNTLITNTIVTRLSNSLFCP